MSNYNSALSYYYIQTPTHGDIDIRAAHTSGGVHTLAPWTDEEYKYALSQINLGSNPNNKLEVVSTLNINNMSRFYTYFSSGFCFSKYNPKVYLGKINSTAYGWNFDEEGINKKEIPWPESYFK